MQLTKKDLKAMIKDIDDEIDEIIHNLRPLGERSNMLKNISNDFRLNKKVSNFQFDRLYPMDVAKNSHPHWTPVEVAIRALELFNPDDETRLLDVGSGCGKFCLIAGLTSKGHFNGVEQREYLVDVAQDLADELQVSNVSFINGDMTDLDWTIFNCLYFFNPFYENKMGTSFWIDDTLPINIDLYNTYIQTVESKLLTTKPGTRVVTYHGFGGVFPKEFRCILREEIWSGHLELWVKES
jgi:hypothetical protein